MSRRSMGFAVFLSLMVGVLVVVTSDRAQANTARQASGSERLARFDGTGVPLSLAMRGPGAVVGPAAVFDAALAPGAAEDTIIYRVCKDLTICYLQVQERQPAIVAPPTALIAPPVQLIEIPIESAGPIPARAPGYLWGGLGLPFVFGGFFLPSDRPGEGAGGGGEPPPGLVPPSGDCACPT
jgi:hypothetical protein